MSSVRKTLLIPSDSYILYAQGKGGRLQNDFRRLETITPYGITNQQLDNTYEQLNAAIGFKASPVSGLWFNLYGGYQDLKNDLIDTPTVKSDGISNVFLTEDTKNLYADADKQWGDGAYLEIEIAFYGRFETYYDIRTV